MTKTHRAIQQWDNWLSQKGAHVLAAEKLMLPPMLSEWYGKHSLLIGVPQQHELLKTTAAPCRSVLSPIANKNNSLYRIESELYELPIASASVNLVILPHSLEYTDNPQLLISEACRIVKPEGYIIIFGFNPYSLWGLKKRFTKTHNAPWLGNFIAPTKVKNWLRLADFELVKSNMLLFRPPLERHQSLYRKLQFLEWVGSRCWPPLGGVYMLMAKAKVIPLTPIKLRWKQKLSGARISTLPGFNMKSETQE